VCETLCFIRQHYERLQINDLKAVICSFYNEDELFGAKDVLLKVIGQVLRDGDVDVDMPRLPKRQGENKLKQTADDVLKIWTIADEHKLYESEYRLYVLTVLRKCRRK